MLGPIDPLFKKRSGVELGRIRNVIKGPITFGPRKRRLSVQRSGVTRSWVQGTGRKLSFTSPEEGGRGCQGIRSVAREKKKDRVLKKSKV